MSELFKVHEHAREATYTYSNRAEPVRRSRMFKEYCEIGVKFLSSLKLNAILNCPVRASEGLENQQIKI